MARSVARATRRSRTSDHAGRPALELPPLHDGHLPPLGGRSAVALEQVPQLIGF
jgi:hypothetical protein